MASSSRTQLEAWLATIDVPEGAAVLDVGGAQKPVKGRTKSWGAISYKILDLPIPHEGNRPDIGLDIQTRADRLWVDKGFDMAFCLEVSEYWSDPAQALKNISSLLKKGGVLYISFHAVFPPHAPTGRDYLRYTLAGATRLLEEADFGEIGVVPRVPLNPEALMDFYEMEGMKWLDSEVPSATGWLVRCRKI